MIQLLIVMVFSILLGANLGWLFLSSKCLLILRDARKIREEALKEHRQARELHVAYQAAMRSLPKDSICLRTR